MPHTVTLIPGDGTGPEITEATRGVLEATPCPTLMGVLCPGYLPHATCDAPRCYALCRSVSAS